MLQGVWKYIGVMILLGGLSVGLVGCSGLFSQDIMDILLKEEYIDSFYGKGVERQIVNDRVVGEAKFSEWKKGNDKYRVDMAVELETYAGERSEGDNKRATQAKVLNLQYIFNNDCIVFYNPDENRYFIKKSTLEDLVKENVAKGINVLTINDSAKEFTMSYISNLTQNFNIEVEDDVKINGRNTQHLIAVGKTQDYRDARKEVWIDQSTWLILKRREQQGNYAIEYEYLDFQINPRLDEKLFDITMNEDAKVEEFEEELYKIKKDIQIEEIPSYFGNTCYRFIENDDLELVSVKYIEGLEGAEGRIGGIVALTYKTKEGIEILVDNLPVNSVSAEFETSEKKVKIGELDALYYEKSNIKLIRLVHPDVVCDVYVRNDKISKEELIEYAKRLKVIKN